MAPAALVSFGAVRERPLSYEEAPTPSPGAGEVLIRIAACGVCRPDLHVVEGELPAKVGAGLYP